MKHRFTGSLNCPHWPDTTKHDTIFNFVGLEAKQVHGSVLLLIEYKRNMQVQIV
jgi:hypothetical protein